MNEEIHNNIFSDEEIENIGEFVGVLKQIRRRLIEEKVDLDAEKKKLGIYKDPS